ncbi:polysaccharide deacetylase family protein [Streptococcus halichoeri]|uniref:polysaccharide deacetylase family protein n=1 Tax=Streptococcus halichoeri TaxID=254785 RepID=UPI00135B78EB|nr:polysaccharide deacetylase family protein [Streptococcus halichoeri]
MLKRMLSWLVAIVLCLTLVLGLLTFFKPNLVRTLIHPTTARQVSRATHKPVNQSKTSPSSQIPQTKKAKQQKANWQKTKQPVAFPILMYHAIHVMAPQEAPNANLIIAPQLFEEQIKALKSAGYYFLTPAEAYRVLTQQEKPAEKIVWLTFDDSMIDFYKMAYPILRKYQAKATNNVITGLTQAKSPANLTLEQMKEMKQEGMSFEDHTVNHPDLAQSDPATQEAELADSKHYLDQELDQTTTTVAYPSGRYTEQTLAIAKALGYKLGLTTNEGLASQADGLLSLNRVRMMPTTSAQQLLAQIAIAN